VRPSFLRDLGPDLQAVRVAAVVAVNPTGWHHPVVQERPDIGTAEETRQRSIARYAEDARAWWDSGRIYYIVKLSLGGTLAQLMSHAAVEGRGRLGDPPADRGDRVASI
jgi:hypothetical protein